MTAVARTSRSRAVRRTEPERALSLLSILWPEELAVLPDEADRRALNDALKLMLIGDPWKDEKGKKVARSLVACAVNLWQELAPQDAIERGLVLAAIRTEIVTLVTAHLALPSRQRGDPSTGIRDFVRLTGASAALLQQLDRWRRGVQQRVVVEHVHVEAGGQAIVGAVDLNARDTRKGRGR